MALESPDQPEVIGLIAALDAYQASLYPPESCYALDLESLKQPTVLFAVARSGTGAAVACGAIVLNAVAGDGSAAGAVDGELKRLYVDPQQRGQGLARAVLALLETEAVARGCTRLRLETGPLQPEALALYAATGYQRCGRFGAYADDPLSVFMQKNLVAQAPG